MRVASGSVRETIGAFNGGTDTPQCVAASSLATPIPRVWGAIVCMKAKPKAIAAGLAGNLVRSICCTTVCIQQYYSVAVQIILGVEDGQGIRCRRQARDTVP